MVMEQFSRTDLKFMTLAFFFASLAYVFVDVAMSGVINIFSVIAYLVVMIVVMIFGPTISRRLEQ